MVSTYSLGRLFHIRVGFHVSWIVLFGLMTWSIAGSIQGVAPAAAAVLGALCALLVFGSVIAHEMAHVVIARRFNIQTSGITLFIFGGVATFETEPGTPVAEFSIALAGPLASGILALVAYGAMRLADASGSMPLLGAIALVLAYLSVANAALAVFNLIPAFPMDGGRVLRALVWMRTHDRPSATIAAAIAGVTLALAAIVASLVMLGSTHSWPYVWYATLGGFIAWSGWTHLRAASKT